MSVFDLLFIALFVTTAGLLVVAGYSAVRGRRRRSAVILRRLGIVWAAYLGVTIITSAIKPRRALNVGERICYDDWCIGVEHVEHSAATGLNRYVVTLRLSSVARRVSQRENGIVVYLTDDSGRRFDPLSEQSAIGLNVLLGPHESVTTKRTFDAPADLHNPGLVIAHEGGIPMGWLIIGDEGWFRKPTIVKLTDAT